MINKEKGQEQRRGDGWESLEGSDLLGWIFSFPPPPLPPSSLPLFAVGLVPRTRRKKTKRRSRNGLGHTEVDIKDE
jgi:hypothetical protein